MADDVDLTGRGDRTAFRATLPARPTFDLRVGEQVGDYLIAGRCGVGGFAAVYRASHLATGRPVALKVLHHALATTPKLLRRFAREVELLERLRHPNIVEVHELLETADGRPCFAMEWIDGVTLAEELRRRGPWPLADTIRMLDQLCAALDAAHGAGVVHRDLKSSNVMLVPSPPWQVVKVLDFGIAKLVDPELDDAPPTTVGIRLGSPQCMAPEQILGGTVDPRTDVYALGVLLYELLAGVIPFDGGTPAATEELHLGARPRPLGALVEVAPAVDAVVLRCLEKEPARRYAGAGEVAAALRAAAA